MDVKDKVRVEFPLSEITALAPLIRVGIIPEPTVDPAGITGKEGWIAQGLEGKAFIEVDLALATAIVSRLGRYCSRIVNLNRGT